MRTLSNKEKLMILNKKKEQYFLLPYTDVEEIDECLEYVKFTKKFFIKLHNNKDINVNLLVNHLILLFNCFNRYYIIKYLMLSINPEHLIYLKTILIYMKKIDIKNEWFIDIPISYDFDYLLNEVNNRNFN